MWPLVILGAGIVAIAAFTMGKKKVADRPTVRAPSTPATHHDHVDAMRTAVREQAPAATADPTVLSVRAEHVAKHLRNEGQNYNPAIVSDYQRLANLGADGVYGRKTRASLIRNGVEPTLAPPAMGRSRRA